MSHRLPPPPDAVAPRPAVGARASQLHDRLARAAQGAGHAMAVTDARHRLRWHNAAFAALVAAVQGPDAVRTRLNGRALAPLLQQLGLPVEQDGPLRQALREGGHFQANLRRQDHQGRLRCNALDMSPAHPVPQGPQRADGHLLVLVDTTAQVSQQLRTEALLAALPTGVLLRGANGRVIDCNPAAERLLQMPREQLLAQATARSGWRMVQTDMSPMPMRALPSWVALETGRGVHDVTVGVLAEQGQLHWLLVNAEPVRDALGAAVGVVSTYTDITEQRHQQAVLAHTVAAAGLGTWRWNMRSGEMQFNERLLTMLGWRPGELASTMDAWSALVHPEDRAVWLQALRQHLANPTTPCVAELRVQRPDGDWAAVQTCGVVIAHGPDGRASEMAGINIDLTEQTQMQAMLRHAARTDGLTQLPNRAAVFDHVQTVIDRARRQPGFGYAVLFMDFDRFKQVNDTLGHTAGDELLRQIANRLRNALRRGDVVQAGASWQHTAGRIGGDEFVVVLEGVQGRDEAAVVAKRLMDVLAAPYDLGSQVVHSSASIGIVTSDQAANDAHTLMRDADTAMYEAKRAGRARWVMFDPSMHERVARVMALEDDLRQALMCGQLRVVYQPVVPLQPQARLGLEALVRWQHPTRGAVPPTEFIPLAEDTGLIQPLGMFVLREACAQFVQLRHSLGDAAPASVAVNLSTRQLQSPQLVQEVADVLRHTGMPPAALQLEVTESLAAQDELARERLRELKALGLRLALDDFGTGYSSLACLHQLPVDTVKIDRSFVEHALGSAYHRVLIEATIRVAHTLGMDTVAEGIETAGQAELMTQLQCERGQGWLFSRPLEAVALPEWLLARARAVSAARDAEVVEPLGAARAA